MGYKTAKIEKIILDMPANTQVPVKILGLVHRLVCLLTSVRGQNLKLALIKSRKLDNRVLTFILLLVCFSISSM